MTWNVPNTYPVAMLSKFATNKLYTAAGYVGVGTVVVPVVFVSCHPDAAILFLLRYFCTFMNFENGLPGGNTL